MAEIICKLGALRKRPVRSVHVVSSNAGVSAFTEEFCTIHPLDSSLAARAAPNPSTVVGGRILVVDDEPALPRVYIRWLESAGHTVESATDGKSAATLVAEKTFDVIVSDIAMQGMDGVQLVQAVRERDLDVPVVLMTGTPAVETAIKAVEYGALRYLVKPFEETVFRDVVAQALRLHKIAKLKRQALALVGEGNNSSVISLDSARASTERWLLFGWRISPSSHGR
jgi:CheY-like chemotaxis protein